MDEYDVWNGLTGVAAAGPVVIILGFGLVILFGLWVSRKDKK